MSITEFDKVIFKILEKNHRYGKGAYYLVREGLEHTMKNLKPEDMNPEDTASNHVSGQLLLKGIKDYALIQYGPMTKKLLDEWNVRSCSDFGEIVFILIEYGVFGKNDKDKKEDFANGYNFEDAFVKPFLPKSKYNNNKSPEN